MKQEIWASVEGYLLHKKYSYNDTLIGTIEIEPVKKVVTKQHVAFPDLYIPADTIRLASPIPNNAKNIRILYDVEE